MLVCAYVCLDVFVWCIVQGFCIPNVYLFFVCSFYIFLIKNKKFLENPKPLLGGLCMEMPRMEFTRHTW